MNALLSAAQWVVGKALAPVADGVLEAWSATNNLGLNIEALKMELLLVKATLETASRKQIDGKAMEELLGMLRDSARCAEDLLDELDYFRIHDELHGTYDAAGQHAKGGVHDLALNARHAAVAVGKRVSCCAWPRARQRSGANSSSAPNANQEVSGCMPKLGKLLPCSSSPHVHDGNSGAPEREPAQETPMLEFNRVDISERIKQIIDQLQPVHRGVTKILQSCEHMTAADIAQSRPVTTCQSIEPKLYGRDHIMNNIIHDMTKGKYHGKDLTVLPIVGPGGIGKTTMIQHIYQNKEVRNHFQILIWACVSVNFNLNKLLEDIKKDIPPVEGENGHRPEVLIEQRLKSKRFLLVLDDIWECGNEDDWKRLLLPLKTSQKEGSIILVTTRFPAIAKMVETTNHIELEGLESEYFRKLFHAFVFGDDQCRNDHSFLLETGDKIMEKLKGSPLAAKTVGALLRKDLNLRHWRKVLESKEWKRQIGANDIMPALKLSYDHLPVHLQKCFSYAALFPEDFHFSSSNLINLWIGLDILQPDAGNQTFQDIGLRNLNDLVKHGFFREEKINDCSYYVMHDLLHDLALQVASHDCISLHHSNIGSVEIQPSIRHMSIIIDDLGADNGVSNEKFKSELRKLKTRLKVEHLQTLMLFGKMDESFANILGDLFREANTLRVLHLVDTPSSVESMLHNFSTLIHLRYLCLGKKKHDREMLPPAISRFYHLRILDLGYWYGCSDLPRDLSNLAKLCRFYTRSDELHSDIYNVGKLRLLEELKVFRVNKEDEGFEPTQLEHLTGLRELGIYNLENIHKEEEAAKANLMGKNYLEKLTLDWDSKRSNTEPGVESVVLDSLKPHIYLKELCIRGHGGPSCPAWLITLESLESLRLVGVSWQSLPSLGKLWGLCKVELVHIAALEEFVIEQSFRMLIRLELFGLGSFKKWVPSQDTHHMFPLLQTLIIRYCPKLLELPFSSHIVHPKPDQNWNIDWFPKLQELEIMYCPELLLVAQIPWTGTLCRVKIRDVRLLGRFEYDPNSYFGVSLEIFGKGDLQSLDHVVAINKLTGIEYLELRDCPPLEWKHLLMLTSLKTLHTDCLEGLVGPSSGGEADVEVEWQHPVVEELCVRPESLGGPSGKELTELLTHLPRLSRMEIRRCKNITQVAVGVDLQQTKSAATLEKKEDGLLLFPAHLSDSLQDLGIQDCPEMVLVDPLSALLPAQGGGGGGFQALQSLRELTIVRCPKIFSAKSLFSSPSCCLFPSSLQQLFLNGAKGLGTLEPLSNLTSLTLLKLVWCGEDLRCKGLEPLLTSWGLVVRGSPGFFAGWDPIPTQVLQDEGGEEQHLESLETDDAMGLLAMPICSLLSSSLTHLTLHGTYYREMEQFTKEQEDALPLLASLQELEFSEFNKLQSLPATLHKLTNLKVLRVVDCPAVRSLPKDGLPKSLQVLNVSYCENEELIQQCKGLVGTIPPED